PRRCSLNRWTTIRSATTSSPRWCVGWATSSLSALGARRKRFQAGAQAQDAGSPAAAATRWSDPASWPNRKVPAEGDKVVIPRGKEVILDVSPPPLGGLSIDGKLTFSSDSDLELTTEWIMLHGELEIGTADRPHARNATITFTDNVKGEDVMAGMGDRGIMISGGTLNLH